MRAHDLQGILQQAALIFTGWRRRHCEIMGRVEIELGVWSVDVVAAHEVALVVVGVLRAEVLKTSPGAIKNNKQHQFQLLQIMKTSPRTRAIMSVECAITKKPATTIQDRVTIRNSGSIHGGILLEISSVYLLKADMSKALLRRSNMGGQ